jgi:1-deoxy-D-xylulose-5-phosphate synthase
MEITPGPLLKTIDSPADLKKLPREKLHQVCDELRQYIIDVVSVHGGHFGASLGVVELTTALHYVYNTPYDQLVWDVGHQAYGHKILTGRRDNFPSNRKYIWCRAFLYFYISCLRYGHGCKIQRGTRP